MINNPTCKLRRVTTMQQTTNIFYPDSGADNSLIRYIWQINKSDCGVEKEIILPKGTAEIIFNLSEKTLRFNDSENASVNLYRCIINGLNTIPHCLIKNESQLFIGIQLHPFALKYLFGIPNKEFTNQVLDGFTLCNSLEILFDELASVVHFERRVALILKWFKEKIECNNRQSDKSMIFDLYYNADIEKQSVKSISKAYNLSDRHLRRLSNDYLGINTEDFILYRKYLKSLLQLHDTKKSLTEVAYLSDYYDQPHFIREFKAFTGLTPGEYRKNMSGLPGHLFF